MKCIHCGNDCKYKDRPSGYCPRCHKRFAFEPKNRDPFTDMAFQSAIDAVSANGQVRWGVEHLCYELCRRLRRRAYGWGIFAIITVVLGLLLNYAEVLWVIVFVLPAWLGIWLLLRRYGLSPLARLDQNEFDALWQRWVEVHGRPQSLIGRKEKPKSKKVQEPDIGDYSFDRAVICDRARTVDLLIANNFHFENNCAVLSIGGYPEGPFETVRAMLKRNPKLQVFALHDATAVGCKLAHRLANDPEWFQGQVPVTDVGLRPHHAPPFRGLLLPASASSVVTPDGGVTAREIAWLNKYVLELAAIRPEQILKRLFRAINQQTDQVTDDTSFISDAGDSDGGPDSFG